MNKEAKEYNPKKKQEKTIIQPQIKKSGYCLMKPIEGL